MGAQNGCKWSVATKEGVCGGRPQAGSTQVVLMATAICAHPGVGREFVDFELILNCWIKTCALD